MPKLAVAWVVAVLFAPLALAADATAPATEPGQQRRLVAKVEHFFASAPDAEKLFLFFRDTLQLPQVWAYQTWGEFASGGVSLGNAAFELVWWQVPAGEELATEFAGIALEPGGPTDAAVLELARRGIAHDAPQPNVHVTASGQKVGWVNTGLPELAPWNVFFCDYLARERVAEGRRKASEELARLEGGPLGVLRLEEIVLGAADLESARRHWRKLLDSPDQEADGVFTFGDGPRVRLVSAAKAAIQGVVVRVALPDAPTASTDPQATDGP